MEKSFSESFFEYLGAKGDFVPRRDIVGMYPLRVATGQSGLRAPDKMAPPVEREVAPKILKYIVLRGSEKSRISKKPSKRVRLTFYYIFINKFPERL